ncbi:MAG TPA: 2-hydroxyacid dehydrogenase [Spirochaetota bacterium]|nr:2-hydroxyacid dehydrogenase [Spirochaetota bacterium]
MNVIVSFSPLPPEFIVNILHNHGITDIEVINVYDKPKDDILLNVSRADIIIGDYTFKHSIDREMIAAMKKVKLIQQPSAGYQHIDIMACKEAQISVANTAGANSISVAEYTILAALCLLKNIFFASRTTAKGEWQQMQIRPVELYGKTWGIVGMGRIGKLLAQRLIVFGVTILYYDPWRLTLESEQLMSVKYVSFYELIKTSDIISLHCPLTEETKGLLGKEELSTMKSSAIIINVARGEIIDENALADALKEGRIAGAALDVFSDEPINSNNPLLKVDNDRLLLTPHVAGVSIESQIRIINLTIENIIAVISGREPVNIIV